MLFKAPFTVYTSGSARLWGLSYPGSYASTEASLAQLRDSEVHTLVCLLESSELAQLGLSEIASLCKQHHLQFLHFPLEDRSTPDDPNKVADLATTLHALLTDGDSVAIHCRAGIGRTGMILAAVLGRFGLSLEEAYRIISAGRGRKVPDTPGQLEWMAEHWELMLNVR